MPTKPPAQASLFDATPSTPRLVVCGPRSPAPRDGRVVVNTTSCGKDWGRGLSPFLLGPVTLYGGHVSLKMENAYQYCKLYPAHADGDGNPTPLYHRWARLGWGRHSATRYPMGKGVRPLCSIWDGERLDYVQARKRIYIPLYAAAVLGTEAYAALERLHRAGDPIALWDFDGYDHLGRGMTLKDVVENPGATMGHAFVLAILLENAGTIPEDVLRPARTAP